MRVRDLPRLGGVRDRDLPLRTTGVGERDLSLRLALDLVPLVGGVLDKSRRDVALEDCFCPEWETSGDELDLSLRIETFSFSCLFGGSSGEELRETTAGLLPGEGEEEEEEEQLPLSEGERERLCGELSWDNFLDLFSVVLETGEEEDAGFSSSGDILVLDGARVPLRSSVCFLGGGETEAEDLFSLEEGRLCPTDFSRGRSFGSGERCLSLESRSNEDFLPLCRVDFLSLSRSISFTGDKGLGDR